MSRIEKLALSPELERAFAFEARFLALLGEARYLARRDLTAVLQEDEGIFAELAVLRAKGVLADYCRRFKVPVKRLAGILELREAAPERVESHNADFIRDRLEQEKEYLDHLLDDIDPAIRLDAEQREVVLSDEDHTLVIAGAGAGKTTTVAAKVRYLVQRQGVDPKKILVISFTNKAVDELKARIQRDLGIDCPICTFHSAGNAILRKEAPEPLTIVDSSKLYFVLLDYFQNRVIHNERMVHDLVLFFGSYFDAPLDGQTLSELFLASSRQKLETLRSDLEEAVREITDLRTKRRVTISNEVLRSGQEVDIANFLYLNGIDYEYEPVYPFRIQFARKPYTPDFLLSQGSRRAYLEHFALSESGANDRFSPDETQRYKEAIRQKIRLHRAHGTDLVYTFSSYRDGRSPVEHLEESLLAHGFVLEARTRREVLTKVLNSEQSRYLSRLVNLICRFIANFKTNGYAEADFSRMRHQVSNVRTRLFLDICRECYLEYQRFLAEAGAVDFQDMINESARLLREVRAVGQKLDFDYIIVDEYQDISRQRFDLTQALSEVTDAKIMAVGDDWQSIYAFSGSDITLFTRFCEIMGHGRLLKILRTYRNAQEVIDIAGGFIQKNTEQIRKALISPKHIEDPVIIYTFDASRQPAGDSGRGGPLQAQARAVETAIGAILDYDRKEGRPPSRILLLGRFNFDGDGLERSGLFQYITRGARLRSLNYPKADLTFMTAHSAKGLGYDNVIVLNGRNETYGFPAKIADDPVLSLVVREDRSMAWAEERRLFYVALTRTKNRVFFVAPEQNPSEFLLELRRDYRNVRLDGTWNETATTPAFQRACPLCGYPLQLRYKPSIGLRLYLCSNEPEICGFMTNDLKGGRLAIEKCAQCADGYLVVKASRDKSRPPFLGCTNYRADKRGCGNIITLPQYYGARGWPLPGTSPDPAKAQPISLMAKSEKPDHVIPPVTGKEAPSAEPKLDQAALRTEPKFDQLPPRAEPEKLPPVLLDQEGRLLLDQVLNEILRALEELTAIRPTGLSLLLDVLRGSASPLTRGSRLEDTLAFGSLSPLPREILEELISWLLEQGFLLQRNRRWPVLQFTPEGVRFLASVSPKSLNRLLVELNGKQEQGDLRWALSQDFALALDRSGHRWDQAEDRQLLREAAQGLDILGIARLHGRSEGAIRARLAALSEQAP